MRLIALLAVLFCTPAVAQICRTRSCRPVVVSKSVPVVVVEQAATPQIFILNNIPAIPAGRTQFRSVYPDVSLIDVNRLAAQALALEQSAVQSRSEHRSEVLDFIERLVEIQRPIAEKIAQGQAAAEVLRESGVLAERDAASDRIDRGAKPSLAQTYCAKCHTGDDARNGFRLDRDFDPGKALLQVANKTMPPDGMPEDQRLGLIVELVEATRKTE